MFKKKILEKMDSHLHFELKIAVSQKFIFKTKDHQTNFIILDSQNLLLTSLLNSHERNVVFGKT